MTAELAAVIVAVLIIGASSQAPVEYEPEFLESLENHTVTQGRDVSFTCVVNHLGPYKVAWIKSDSKAILAIHTHLVAHNNRLTVTHNGHNTWKLKVSNVQKNDSGTYMCQINTDPMRSQMGYLEVVVPPDILNDDNNDDYAAHEGGSIRLRCRATGIPEPKVTWKREDARNIILRHDSGTKEVLRSVDGETLLLSNVQRSDTGSYLCIASNGIPPSVSKRFIVKVHFHPVVKVSNQLVAAPIGSDVLIQCYVEAMPKALSDWRKDTGMVLLSVGEKLMDSSKYEMEEIIINEYSLFMNLTIRSLEKRDFGGYVCSSINALGKAEGVVRLQELHIPKTTPAPVINVNEHHSKGKKKPAVHSKEGKNGNGNRRRKKPRLGEMGIELDDYDQLQVLELTTPELRRAVTSTTLKPPPWTLHHNEVSINMAPDKCVGLSFSLTVIMSCIWRLLH